MKPATFQTSLDQLKLDQLRFSPRKICKLQTEISGQFVINIIKLFWPFCIDFTAHPSLGLIYCLYFAFETILLIQIYKKSDATLRFVAVLRTVCCALCVVDFN